jgi:hypothetical protein
MSKNMNRKYLQNHDVLMVLIHSLPSSLKSLLEVCNLGFL